MGWWVGWLAGWLVDQAAPLTRMMSVKGTALSPGRPGNRAALGLSTTLLAEPEVASTLLIVTCSSRASSGRPRGGRVRQQGQQRHHHHHQQQQQQQQPANTVWDAQPSTCKSVMAMSGSVMASSGSVMAMSGSVMARSGSVMARTGSVMARSGSAMAWSGSVMARSGSHSTGLLYHTPTPAAPHTHTSCTTHPHPGHVTHHYDKAAPPPSTTLLPHRDYLRGKHRRGREHGTVGPHRQAQGGCQLLHQVRALGPEEREEGGRRALDNGL